MDGTLLRGESQFSFLIWLVKRGLVRPTSALRVLGMYSAYLAGLSSDAHRLREAGFGLLKGISTAELTQYGEIFYQSHLSLRARGFAATLVKQHKAAGHETVLVTSAGEPVAVPFAERFEFDGIIATRLLEDSGILTGAVALPEPYADGKQQLVKDYCEQNQISSSSSFAYSDHHSDVLLLELVGNPVAVNPTKKLRIISKQRGWKTLDLEKTSNVID